MKIVDKNNKIKLSELKEMVDVIVNAVLDVEKEVMAVGRELHSGEEALLLEMGCKQENLWGFNIYPEKNGEKFIEFDSIINIKPFSGNRSKTVEDEKIRGKIFEILSRLIEK